MAFLTTRRALMIGAALAADDGTVVTQFRRYDP